MKIAVVLGTRPEIIKMSPIIRILEKRRFNYFIIHTGQHYSYNMDQVFFEQLELPASKYNLEVGSGTHGEQTAKILTGIEKIYINEKPHLILVQGDTNTVLASALAATKLHIEVGHIEAGLRSFDSKMPEETNRILTDHCSDFLFAPTEKSKKILINEGISENKISVTGNTIVDAIYQNIDRVNGYKNILDLMNLKPKQYFLLTLHRQENVDNVNRFKSILDSIDKMASFYPFCVIYPVHPRSKKIMIEYNISPKKIKLVDPVDYFGFLQMEKNALLLLTDSGGVQEEGCVLRTPCVTLRDNTERPETLEVGSNILAGADSEQIINNVKIMLSKNINWKNPFGEGDAGERIVSIISNI